jgi:hypothetical protein
MSKDQLIAAIRSRRGLRSQPKVESPKSKVAVQNLRAGRQQQGEALQELTELPSSYGHTRLTLMGIDPFWIHAYWEITPRDHEAVMARLAPERVSAHWALRFYDVTYVDFDGTNAHSYFDQPVDLAAGNWYVNLWSSEKTYCADIGARAPTGRFEPACRSNFVHMPRADESPQYRPQWLRVEEVFDEPLPPGRMAGASEPATAGTQTSPARAVRRDASGEPRLGSPWHEVRGRFSSTLGSFGGSSWAPASRAAVDVKSNAEAALSGHAPPNQPTVRSAVPVRK